MDRKSFFHQAVFSTGAIVFAPWVVTEKYPETSPAEKEGLFAPDPLPAEKVKDFVVAGHGNIDKARQLLTEFPSLLYATWDWGGGDFETALEGAGHVGNKEIANYLIEKGARTNLFVLTMLGKTGIVKSYLDAYPAYLGAKGPHGFTLLHHAQKGGEEAKELVDYLQSKGLKETKTSL
jgi:hypothetical protein